MWKRRREGKKILKHVRRKEEKKDEKFRKKIDRRDRKEGD